MSRAGALVVAVALDALLREPPLAVHPVRAIGRYLRTASRLVPSEPAARAVVAGGVAWAVGAGLAVAAGTAVERAARGRPAWQRSVVLGVALWPLFAHRMLLDEVQAVERALADGVPSGRAAVARIVSRDVSELSESQVRQAAIESLGENLSDSVVAPLLWYAVGGLPAAALYRYANTADAVWGYRSARWRYAGRVAARVDDLLNLVPARLTGLILAAPAFAGPVRDGSAPARPLVRLRELRCEASRTPSPNAGWPMAALALRLGVRLEKPGMYVLGEGGREPTPADTATALRIARYCGWVVAAACAALAALPNGRRMRDRAGWRDGRGLGDGRGR